MFSNQRYLQSFNLSCVTASFLRFPRVFMGSSDFSPGSWRPSQTYQPIFRFPIPSVSSPGSRSAFEGRIQFWFRISSVSFSGSSGQFQAYSLFWFPISSISFSGFGRQFRAYPIFWFQIFHYPFLALVDYSKRTHSSDFLFIQSSFLGLRYNLSGLTLLICDFFSFLFWLFGSIPSVLTLLISDFFSPIF